MECEPSLSVCESEGVVGDPRIERERVYHDERFANSSRSVVSKYYAVTRGCTQEYRRRISEYGAGRDVLEYGCGTGSQSFFLAQQGARITGIDLSQVAIDQAHAVADAKGLDICFRVANAEQVPIQNASFDLICGSGILHHLDLTRACSELRRLLRPGGRAVFVEPLGHNPVINWYRRRTPGLRTVDEHPLLVHDLKLFQRYFGRVDASYFALFALAAVPFRGLAHFERLLTVLEEVDRLAFRWIPMLRSQAWIVLLTLSEPLPAVLDPAENGSVTNGDLSS